MFREGVFTRKVGHVEISSKILCRRGVLKEVFLWHITHCVAEEQLWYWFLGDWCWWRWLRAECCELKSKKYMGSIWCVIIFRDIFLMIGILLRIKVVKLRPCLNCISSWAALISLITVWLPSLWCSGMEPSGSPVTGGPSIFFYLKDLQCFLN